MKIAMLRTDGSDVDVRHYNSQEVGLARALANEGHTVDIITAKKLPDSLPLEVVNVDCKNPITIVRTGYHLLPVLEYGLLAGLRRILVHGNYDLVHINEENNPSTILAALHCRQLNIPYVIYHGMYLVPTGRARAYYERFHRRFLAESLQRSARAIMAKTTTAKHFLESRGVVNVNVLPVGLDTTRFEALQCNSTYVDQIAGLRARYGRIMLYVGSLEERRNPMLLLDIAQALSEDAALVLVGDGPMSNAARERITDAGMQNVVMTGPVNQGELPGIYKQSDVFLLPSKYEIYGMVLLEALYFGVPCITSDTAGGMDVVGKNSVGAVVNGFELEQWVATIQDTLRLPAEPGSRERLKTLVRQEYSWQKIARQYLDLVMENRR